MQAVSLIASYLEVPLRYPLRLGGSRSYIHDYAPSSEPTSSESASTSLLSSNMKATEFPLFLDGQETTRAAYAVFLLNKVCFLSNEVSGLSSICDNFPSYEFVLLINGRNI